MKERPEQRAARWVHYDRRIEELVDDYQSYANKINFLKVITDGHLTMWQSNTIIYYITLPHFTRIRVCKCFLIQPE